jgi:CheY-like chemotaxis protein
MISPVISAPLLQVLLVEDSLTQAMLMKNVVERSDQLQLIGVARDGEEAMQFLRRTGQYLDAGRPDLILLDLNMPKKDGFEVLQEMKQDEELKSIPVIVFTTSERGEDVVNSYRNGASTFITKPTRLDELASTVENIVHYWTNAKLLPH